MELFHAFAVELEKLAISRLDKEVAQGNVTYSNAVPGAKTKAQAQQAFFQPEHVHPDQLARTRELNGKLYHATADHHHVNKNFMPGAGPNASSMGANVPKESGRFLRTAEKPFGMYRAIAGTYKGMESRLDKALTKEAPVDKTLNKAILHHELGELHDINGKHSIVPHSSHMGTTPTISENLQMTGDPDAQKIMGRLRSGDPGDVAMQKAMRRAGATPGAPIPLHGRQHAAVDRMLGKEFTNHPERIGSAGRQSALTSKNIGGRSIGYNVPKVDYTDAPAAVQNLLSDLKQGKLRSAAKTFFAPEGLPRQAVRAGRWLSKSK